MFYDGVEVLTLSGQTPIQGFPNLNMVLGASFGLPFSEPDMGLFVGEFRYFALTPLGLTDEQIAAHVAALA